MKSKRERFIDSAKFVFALVIVCSSASTTLAEPQKSAKLQQSANVRQYRDLPRSSSTEASVAWFEGVNELRSGKFKSAEAAFDKALNADPKYAAAFDSRGYARAKSGEYQAAVGDFTEVLKLTPDDPLAYFNRAVAEFNLQDFQKSVDDFNQVVRINSIDALAFFYRGMAREGLKDKNADDDFVRVIRMATFKRPLIFMRNRLEIDPKLVFDFYNRSDSRTKPKNTSVQPEKFEETLETIRGSMVHVKQADELLSRRDYKAAIDECNKAIAIDPYNSQAYGTRGVARTGLRDSTGSAQDMDKMRKLSRTQSKYLDAQSKAMHTGTIEEYNDVLRMNPSEAFAYYGRGQRRADLTDYKGAIQEFSQSLKYNPKNGHAYSCRGDARAHLGDNAGADEDQKMAAKYEPVYGQLNMFKRFIKP